MDKGGFTVEPFLFADGRLITWADVEPAQDLADPRIAPDSRRVAGVLATRKRRISTHDHQIGVIAVRQPSGSSNSWCCEG